MNKREFIQKFGLVGLATYSLPGDIIYDKNIPIAVTANQNLEKLTSSRLLEEPFKRSISRLYELTSKEINQ